MNLFISKHMRLFGKGSKRENPSLTNPKKRGSNATGLNIFMLGRSTPLWINTQNLHELAKITSENPVAYAVLSIRANFFANGRVKLRNIETGEEVTRENFTASDYRKDKIVAKAFAIHDRPNVLQSRWEYLQTMSFMKDTFGNGFQYGNRPEGFDFNIEHINAIWNVWPQYMSVVLKGNYFSATEINDIIEEWKFGLGDSKEFKFAPDEILHRRDVNVQLIRQEDIVFGNSRYTTLKYPISNIKTAYESENVILQNRGARLVITPEMKDEITGVEPIEEGDAEELEKQFEDYGFREGQKQAIISRLPVKVNAIEQDIRKLGLFESIASDAMIVAHNFGVPEILIKLYLAGATFENQKQSVIRMYQDTTIPEFEDYCEDMTNWLKLREYGWEYIADFSHVQVLQEDKKEAATANNLNNTHYEKKFLRGGCTYNEWRRATGDKEESWGDIRIFELTERELKIIFGQAVPSEEVMEERRLAMEQQLNGEGEEPPSGEEPPPGEEELPTGEETDEEEPENNEE